MSTRDGDNVSYYDALASDYDLFFSNPERSMEEEGDWLEAVLRAHHVRAVLDASCGAGRQAIPLCLRGFNVVAADPSEAMLRQAETRARDHGVSFPMLNVPFADLSSHYNGDFDAVIALGNGLCNLQSREEIERALRSMHACCRPGGICLVGIKDFETIKDRGERFHGHRIDDQDGRRSILFEVWDFQGPTLISTAYLLTHLQGDREATTRSAQTREYMLYDAELRKLARAVGFEQVDRLDHPTEAAYVLQK